MKKEEIIEKFGELVKTGDAFVYEVTERTNAKDETVYDYAIAQQRKGNVTSENRAIYALRGTDLDTMLMCWVSSISEEQHKANIASGFVGTLDSKKNFVPKAAAGIELHVFETTAFDAARHIYFSKKDSEVTVREPKLNPQTGTYPTLKDQPIYRTVKPTFIEDAEKDVIVKADGSFDKDELDNWSKAMLKKHATRVAELEK